MFASPPLARWLFKLGLSRFSAAMLLVFFAMATSLHHALPADESVIQVPLLTSLIVFLSLFLISFAIQRECQKPRLYINTTAYWKSFFFSLTTLCIYATFCAMFGPIKSLIPLVHPYGIDPLLQRIDMFLHGGTAPSLWFADRLNANAVALMNTLYLSCWGLVMLFYCTWQITLPPSHARSQYLSCFFLLWIIAGILLATALSSVGPIYYSLFYTDAYSVMNADFVTRLYHDSTSETELLDARNLLLSFLHDDTIISLNGISAMPSLHNGMSMLMATHSYYYHRRLAWFMIPFAVLIFLGSFILGWHYAIDTYVSAICLAIIWRITLRDVAAYQLQPKPRPSS